MRSTAVKQRERMFVKGGEEARKPIFVDCCLAFYILARVRLTIEFVGAPNFSPEWKEMMFGSRIQTWV